MPSNSHVLLIHSHYLKVAQWNVLDARPMWHERQNTGRCQELWVEVADSFGNMRILAIQFFELGVIVVIFIDSVQRSLSLQS